MTLLLLHPLLKLHLMQLRGDCKGGEDSKVTVISCCLPDYANELEGEVAIWGRVIGVRVVEIGGKRGGSLHCFAGKGGRTRGSDMLDRCLTYGRLLLSSVLSNLSDVSRKTTNYQQRMWATLKSDIRLCCAIRPEPNKRNPRMIICYPLTSRQCVL